MNLECSEELIIKLVANELNKMARKRVLNHISQCNKCRKLYLLHSELENSLVQRKNLVPAGKEMAKAVFNRLQVENGRLTIHNFTHLHFALLILGLTGSIALFVFRDFFWLAFPSIYNAILRISLCIIDVSSWWISVITNTDTGVLWTIYISIPIITSLIGGWRILAGVRKV
jgi:hypothetical protein